MDPVQSNPPRGMQSSEQEPASNLQIVACSKKRTVSSSNKEENLEGSVAAEVRDRGKQIQHSATSPLLTDEIELMETPVQLVQEGQEWALVASPLSMHLMISGRGRNCGKCWDILSLSLLFPGFV